jgi:hypothetical protein
MDAFDAADYEALLPRRWKKRIATAVLLSALLFPNQLRDIFVPQVERHAQHLTAEFPKMMLPETSPNHAPIPAPAPRPKQAGPKE